MCLFLLHLTIIGSRNVLRMLFYGLKILNLAFNKNNGNNAIRTNFVFNLE